MDKLNKKGLQKLLDETVAQLSEVIEKAEKEGAEALAKTDPGEETSAEKTPSKESQAGSAPEGSPEESSSSSSSEGPASSEAPAPEAPPAAAPTAEGAVPEGGPAQEMAGEVTVEGLQAEYQAMPVEEQKMHLLALKAALMTTMAAAEPAQAPAAPAAPPVAPPAAAPPPAPMMMSETDPKVLERIESLEKTIKEKDEIITGFGKVAEGLKNLFVSQRKSVHSISVVGKPGDQQLNKSETDVTSLTKSQVDQKLKEVIGRGNLKKSDKDLIIEYTAGTTKDVSKIAHLIK